MTQPNPPDEQENAYILLTQMLTEWGLGALAPEVLRMLQDGYTQQQIPILLQDTDAYKQRFRGNQSRREKGLAVLSPAEYLQVERSYRQIMAQAGLPAGFYDSPDDFAGWIGDDVAPVEVQRRVDEAVDATVRLDENTKASFRDLYGLYAEDLAAFILDPVRGRAELNKIVHGGRIAGAARGLGVNLTREQAERYGAMSTNEYIKEAQQFAQLASAGQRLSNIYSGEDYGVEEAASEVFQASTEASRRRRQLFAREEAEFSGTGGSGRTALSQGVSNY